MSSSEGDDEMVDDAEPSAPASLGQSDSSHGSAVAHDGYWETSAAIRRLRLYDQETPGVDGSSIFFQGPPHTRSVQSKKKKKDTRRGDARMPPEGPRKLKIDLRRSTSRIPEQDIDYMVVLRSHSGPQPDRMKLHPVVFWTCPCMNAHRQGHAAV